ncbi:regulatory GntR family protein [Haloactinopolyspora alba]|uniref:Regulatory GntR family protein n=1 Tax=Haloactinopolyspora alba TaxID=648780 RepID=A0A2P8DGJ7_9ACTN|nr:winged helix-turn-helix domain-containing protein [Haloactinopolyspora alba]PSK96342.1 regulatory GntR family protein [Haloactinopolyspora alba]
MSDVPDFEPQEHELRYVALADHVVARIDAGELVPGARLPPERELAVEYGVAYLTVRRAMAELRDRGRIKTVHGKGTFVAPPVEPE